MEACLLTKAAVLYGPGKLRVEEFELGNPSSDEGILRVEATGVCGTDIASYHGEFNEYALPRVLGHEVVGTIEEIGADAANRWGAKRGDRVAVEEYLPCGTCRACLSGAYTICHSPKYGSRSTTSEPSVWGAYSDYMYLDRQSIVHHIPEHVSPVTAQLYIPIANGLHWVQEVAKFRAGGTIVVLGPGAHGLACVIAAKETGAENIVLVGLETDSYRLEVGRKLGATHLISIDDVDVVGYINELTNGRMADAVVNLAPSPAALALAISVAGEQGKIVHGAIGGTSDNTSIPADRILRKTLTITGVRGRPTWAAAAALKLIASERYPLDLLNTHTYSVLQTEEALESASNEDNVVRAVVVPSTKVNQPNMTSH